MWWFIVTFVCGMAIGKLMRLPVAVLQKTPWIVVPALALLVFALGEQLGANHSLIRTLPELGAESVVIGILSMVGSAMAALSVQHWIFPNQANAEGTTAERHKSASKASSSQSVLPWFILLMVIVGSLVGYFIGSDFQIPISLENTVFAFMLLGIGIEIGSNPKFWHQIKRASWKMFFLPVITIVGSLAGGFASGLILGGSYLNSVVAAAGLGWYSMAGVLVNHVAGPAAGTVAFLANVIRELLCFVAIPWLTKRTLVASAISTGGATTMDTTLALFSGAKDARVVYAFIHGVMTSALVPVIIPFVFRFAS